MVGHALTLAPTGSKRSKSSRTLVGFVTGMVTAGSHLIPRHLAADHPQAKAGSQRERCAVQAQWEGSSGSSPVAVSPQGSSSMTLALESPAYFSITRSTRPFPRGRNGPTQ
jgi:hypothetical protein